MALMSSLLLQRDCQTYKYEWLLSLAAAQIPCGQFCVVAERMMKHSTRLV